MLPFSVREECSSSEFQCGNGQCISSSLHCDGNRDCLDHSDEEGCPVALRCPEGEMRCPKSGECVLTEWICDHDADCKDGTDEKVASPLSDICRGTIAPDQPKGVRMPESVDAQVFHRV